MISPMKRLLLLLFVPVLTFAQRPSALDISRWEARAKRVTIIRDAWGIPHIYAPTDADAVFGMLYAQCEDNFARVEMNYIEKLGRMAEVQGQKALAGDLYIRLVIDADEAQADYHASPDWLRALMDAHADGINYYLYRHPEVRPKLLTHFEPWYSLTWTDGSIGAISTGDIGPRDVGQLYLGTEGSMGAIERQPVERLTGSNGFAIGPSRSASGHAILYINPHVTFYFRPEIHVVSDEGLNVYGAVTWGQFFVYQGFNEHCGWMHTSSEADVSDMYAETIIEQSGRRVYRYDGGTRPVGEKKITLRYASGDSTIAISVSAMVTHHGPVMARRHGQYLSVRSTNRSLQGLVQSYQRTKSTGFASFKKAMELTANASNNTVFADDRGNIAYWHGNFLPKRDPSIDWSLPVDGTTPSTEWKGLHPVEESIHIYNPSSGWIQNCNSTPYTASGESSPRRTDYPSYMAPDEENFRALNAMRVLGREKAFTIDKLIAAGYDPSLTAFEILVPALVRVFERDVRPGTTMHEQLKEPMSVLKAWDHRTSVRSIAMTLAHTWGQKLSRAIYLTKADEGENDAVGKTRAFASRATASEIVEPLLRAVQELDSTFGTWKTPWGDVNRFQRLDGGLDERHDDAQSSLPVGFASARWGMLAAYSSRTFEGTKKMYGFGGNSFIAAVEFGERLKAKSLLAGGQSGDPRSKHFSDQAEMYATGRFKDVHFYKEDVLKNAEATYHPGDEPR
jgi:acyl-homoserine lactone acylase PvdQ